MSAISGGSIRSEVDCAITLRPLLIRIDHAEKHIKLVPGWSIRSVVGTRLEYGTTRGRLRCLPVPIASLIKIVEKRIWHECIVAADALELSYLVENLRARGRAGITPSRIP